MGDRPRRESDLALAQTACSDGGAATGAAEPELGATVGRFTVLHEIGRGGMGVVVAAYDPDLDRKVAIKLLRSDRGGSSSSTGSQARLVREAQAMARLSHDNVVTVYDVGTLDDQVFVAMELVEGTTLTGWLREQTRSMPEILAAFAQAGRGLHAAHEAGLVHRDFKPDNALVRTDGRVLVTDFGLVGVADSLPNADGDRALPDHASPMSVPLTVEKGVLGTPRYMSPEQHAHAPVDHRSDQYSFCVALYEALYGQAPFSGKTYYLLVQSKRNGRVPPEPARSRVPPKVRAALLRGLSSEPADRFPSMQALLETLTPPATAHRRRLAAAIAVVAVAGAVGAVVALRPAGGQPAPCSDAADRLAGTWNAERRAQIEQAFRASGRAHAEATLERTVAALDAYAGAWVDKQSEVCRATEVSHEQPEAVMHLRMACLAQRRTELNALVELFRSADAEVVDHAATAAGGLIPISRCDDLSSLQSIRPLPADPKARREVEQLRAALARFDALFTAGRFIDARAEIQAAELRSRSVDYLPVRATALYKLGVAQQYSGETAAAEETLRAAARLAAELGDDKLLAESWMHLAWVVGQMQTRPQEGLALIETAETTLARAGDPPEVLAELHVIAGAIADNAGQRGRGREHLLAAIALAPRLEANREIIATAHNNLANLYSADGDFEQSAASLREAGRIYEQAVGPNHPLTSVPMVNMGDNYLSRHEPEKALPLCRRAAELLAPFLEPDHPEHAYAISCQGRALLELGDPAAALPLLESYLEFAPANPNAPWELSEVQHALARALWDTNGDRRRARELAERARPGLVESSGRKQEELERLDEWLSSHRLPRRRKSAR